MSSAEFQAYEARQAARAKTPQPEDGPLKCVLCGDKAVTAAAHISVCEAHWQEYSAEAKQYLPAHERHFFNRLLAAEARRDQLTSEGDQEIARTRLQRETALHCEIITYCNAQWPRWKYVHARTDQRSTIAIGCQDFTIFAPHGIFLIECKRVGGKLSLEQLSWAAEMRQLGYAVHVIETFAEFLRITHYENQTPDNKGGIPKQ